MNTDEGKLNWQARIDTSGLDRDASHIQQQFSQIGNTATSEGARMEDAFKKVGATMSAVFTVNQMRLFCTEAIRVRAEMEAMNVSFQVLIGSKDKADALFNSLRQFAATTPMMLKDLAAGAQTMLGFNIPLEQVEENLRAIGDISMGDAQKFQSLTLAFSQMSATGKLMGQDLLQMINAGFNPLTVMAEQTGKSIAQLKDEMSKGAISADMVRQAFISATSAGGKFDGMLEKQGKSLQGAFNQLSGAVQDMYAEIGEKLQPVVMDSVDGAKWLAENYATIGKVLVDIIAVYGTYKAVIMLTAAAHQAAIQEQIFAYQALLPVQKGALDTDLQQAVAAKNVSNEKALQLQAIRNEINMKMTEMRVNLQQAAQEESQARQRRINALQRKRDAEAEHRIYTRAYADALKQGDAERAAAMKKAAADAKTRAQTAAIASNTAAKELNAATTARETAATQLNTMQQGLNTVQKKTATTATSVLAFAHRSLAKALDSVKVAMATNPFTFWLTAASMLLGTVLTLTDLLGGASDATGHMNEESQKYGETAMKLIDRMEMYKQIADSTAKTSKVHKEAVEELVKIYEDYGIHIDDERDKLEQLNLLRDEAIRKIREEGEERQKALQIAAMTDAIQAATERMEDKLLKGLQSAEWEGTAYLIDDWDADDFQERAEEVSKVASAIIQAEQERLRQLAIDGNLTDEEIDNTVNHIRAKIMQAAKDMGVESNGIAVMSNEWTAALYKLDVDFEGIARDFITNTNKMMGAREDLSRSMKKTTKDTREEAETVDYEKMQFDELYKAAYDADAIIKQLANRKVSPFFDTSSLDNFIQQQHTALNNMFYLMGTPTAGMGYTYQSPQLPKATLDPWGTKKFGMENYLGFDYTQFVGGWNSLQYQAAYQQQKDAQAEMSKRINSANTRSSINALLKDINAQLDSATIGGEDEKRLLEWKKQLEARISKTKNKGGDNRTKEEVKAETQRDQIALDELIRDQAKERQRLDKELEMQRWKNRIDLMEEGEAKIREQRKYDFEREQQQAQQQREDAIAAEIARQKAEFEARERIKKTKDKKYVEKNFTAADVNQASIDGINKQYDLIDQQVVARHAKQLQQDTEAAKAAMDDYLEKYGTFKEREQAIRDKAERKMSQAKNTGEWIAAMRQMDSDLGDLYMQQLKKSINWEVVFNGLDKLSLEHLQKLKKQLRDALDAKEITAEQAQVISGRINAINAQIQTKGKEWRAAFGLVIPELEEIRRLQKESEEAQKRLTKATEKYNDALEEVKKTRQDILAILEKEGIKASEGDITIANKDTLTKQMTDAGKSTDEINGMFEKLGKQEITLAKNTEALSSAETEAGMAAEQATGSFATTVAVIDKIVHGINDNIQSANELFEQMGIQNTKFGKGFNDFAESSKYATEAWESLKSGNVMGVANGVYGSLRKLGDALGNWGVDGFGSSNAGLADMVEDLIRSNADLEQSVDRLTKAMEKEAGSAATKNYEDAKKNLEQAEQNAKKIIQDTAGTYSNGFLGIGGKHSANKHINDAMNGSDWSTISQIVGHTVNSAGDFWNLTSDQMAKVAEQAPTIWTKIKNASEDGYAGVSQYLDDYITYYEKLNDLANQWRETITGISFDSAKDGLRELLKDTTKGIKDATAKVREYMQDAILEWIIKAPMKEALENWYKDFAEAMKDDELSKSEASALQSAYENIYKNAAKKRDLLYQAAGIKDPENGDYNQDSTRASLNGATQDQMNESNGRLTSVQLNLSVMSEKISEQMVSLLAIENSNRYRNSVLDDMLDLVAVANDYLATIAKNTGELPGIREVMQKVKENTDRI